MSYIHHYPLPRAVAWFTLEVLLGLLGLNLLTPGDFGFPQKAPLTDKPIAVDLAIAGFCIEHPLCVV